MLAKFTPLLFALTFLFVVLCASASLPNLQDEEGLRMAQLNAFRPFRPMYMEPPAVPTCGFDDLHADVGGPPRGDMGTYPGWGPALIRRLAFFFYLYKPDPVSDPTGVLSTPTKEPVSFYVNGTDGLMGPRARTFWNYVTNGKITFRGLNAVVPEAFGWFATNVTLPCGNCGCGNDVAWSQVQPQLYKRQNFNDSKYDHIVFVPIAGDICGVAGVPGKYSVQQDFNWGANAYTWWWAAGNMVHEIGHNLGFRHANTLNCASSANKISANCTEVAYGDGLDYMGGNIAWGIYNTAQKAFKRWLPDANFQAYTTTVTSYTLWDSTAVSVRRLTDANYGTRKFAVYKNNTNPNAFPAFGSGQVLHWVSFDTTGENQENKYVTVRYVTDPFKSRQTSAWYPSTHLAATLTEVGQVFEDLYLKLRVKVVSISAEYAQVEITTP